MKPRARLPIRLDSRPARRQFLADLGLGFTGLVLGTMLFQDRQGAASGKSAAAKTNRGKATSVIWLFMMGGVSHLESFDPKPALNKYAGRLISESPFAAALTSPDLARNARTTMGTPKHETRILPLQVGYRKRGQCGIEVTDWWPCVGDCINDIAVIRSLWTSDFNHSAQCLAHTGRFLLDGEAPALGSWVHYGLGSLNQQLPTFLVLGEPPTDFCGGALSHAASHLGPEHAGVPIDTDPAKALPFPPQDMGLSRQTQEAELELLHTLHRLSEVEYPHDAALHARIQSYELAAGMQSALPEVLDLSRETEQTLTLYGLDDPRTQAFGRQCLVARRLVEKGVRFVQLYHGQSYTHDNGLWDAHDDLRSNHAELSSAVDRPIAGLLRDLKRRGMLDNTLVVWATEFGRAPNVDLRTPSFHESTGRAGRDHHIYGFSAWLAGGGIKGGTVHGCTDELGFHAVEHRHYITDLHATVLHQLGLDPEQLEIPGHRRLAIEVGRPIKEIIA